MRVNFVRKRKSATDKYRSTGSESEASSFFDLRESVSICGKELAADERGLIRISKEKSKGKGEGTECLSAYAAGIDSTTGTLIS